MSVFSIQKPLIIASSSTNPPNATGVVSSLNNHIGILVQNGIRVVSGQSNSSFTRFFDGNAKELPVGQENLSGIKAISIGIASGGIFNEKVSRNHELVHMSMVDTNGNRPQNSQAEETVAAYISLLSDPSVLNNDLQRILNVSMNRGRQSSNLPRGDVNTVITRLRNNGISIPDSVVNPLTRRWNSGS